MNGCLRDPWLQRKLSGDYRPSWTHCGTFPALSCAASILPQPIPDERRRLVLDVLTELTQLHALHESVFVTPALYRRTLGIRFHFVPPSGPCISWRSESSALSSHNFLRWRTGEPGAGGWDAVTMLTGVNQRQKVRVGIWRVHYTG